MIFIFQNPEFFYLLLGLPLIALLEGRPRSGAAISFSSVQIPFQLSKMHASKSGRWLLSLKLIYLACFITALARPQLGEEYTQTISSGVDIMIAVDISSSMLALDFSENNQLTTRLDAVKGVLKTFIQKRPNDRIGIIAFAGSPYVLSPLTLNHDWLDQNFDRLQAGVIEDGTAIGSAIGMSASRLKDVESKSKIAILMTDGYNNKGAISPIAAAQATSAYGIKIYTIGVGQGGVVPALYLDQEGNIARNIWGDPDIIRAEIPIDEEALQSIAEISKGTFFRAKNLSDLNAIYKEIDLLEKTEIKKNTLTSLHELLFWPLLLGLVLLILEQILSNTRYQKIP